MSSLSTPATLAEAIFPVPGVDRLVARIAREAILIAGFTAFMAICAQVAIRLPFTPVPITGQTFGALLTAGALGSKRGATSMALYMILGLVGVPVFAPSGACATPSEVNLSEVGACAHFILPWSGSEGLVWNMFSGGYIVGFIFATFLIGYLVEKGWDRRNSLPFAMVLGNIVIYLFGLPWLAWHIVVNDIPNAVDTTMRWGLYPFIGGDAIKLVAAASILPLGWAIANRKKKEEPWK